MVGVIVFIMAGGVLSNMVVVSFYHGWSGFI
jgi:hypothetical protein